MSAVDRHPKVMIHETAVVDDPVEIGTGTKVWHFSHILAGAIITMRDLAEFATFNSDLLESVKASLAAGKSVDDATATVTSLLADKYKDYGLSNARANVEAIYAELGQ